MHSIIARMRLSLTGMALFVALTYSALAAPGDWPQFRGPNRDGASQEKGLLQDLPPDGPPVVWKATGLGIGYATASVVGDLVYTLGEDATASSVIALNAANGKKVWSAKLGRPGAPGMPAFEGPRSAPTVGGSSVVAIGQWGDMLCLDATQGKELWRKDFTKDFGGKRPQWGFSESALIDGDKVVVTPGGPEGSIVALDRKTGTVIWRSKGFSDWAHYSSLIIAQIAGVRQYVQLTAESVVGIAAADGKVLWRAARKGRTAVIPTPIYSDGYVYVSSGYGVGCNLFKISEAGHKFTAEEVYANKVLGNKHGSVIKIGDYIYGHADDKGWTCQDFKTGEAEWRHNQLRKGSLIYADNRFWIRAEDKGTMVLIEASPAGWKEHGRFEQPDRSDKKAWPYPVIAHGRLYLRDMDTLLCYDVKAN